jgi:hypothetical protein
MAPQEDIRASDADRQRVADALSSYASEGRLSLDELSDRLGETYQAKTIGQLSAGDGPLRELPPLAPPLVVPPGPSLWQDPTRLTSPPPGRWPGMPTFGRGPSVSWALIAVLVIVGLSAGIGAVTGGPGAFWLIFVGFFFLRRSRRHHHPGRYRSGPSSRW